jgi:hypothetical protein
MTIIIPQMESQVTLHQYARYVARLSTYNPRFHIKI